MPKGKQAPVTAETELARLWSEITRVRRILITLNGSQPLSVRGVLAVLAEIRPPAVPIETSQPPSRHDSHRLPNPDPSLFDDLRCAGEEPLKPPS